MITAKKARCITKERGWLPLIEEQIKKSAKAGMLHTEFDCGAYSLDELEGVVCTLKSLGYTAELYVDAKYDRHNTYIKTVPLYLFIKW